MCIGGALEFAASCDLRLATDRARFGTPEVGIGLTYTNAGSHFLPSTMGETAARELLLTGALRDVAWAQSHRFVNEVVPPAAFEERIAAWAAGFDDVSRAAVARTKAMLNDRFGDLLDAAMEREERACIDLPTGRMHRRRLRLSRSGGGRAFFPLALRRCAASNSIIEGEGVPALGRVPGGEEVLRGSSAFRNTLRRDRGPATPRGVTKDARFVHQGARDDGSPRAPALRWLPSPR